MDKENIKDNYILDEEKVRLLGFKLENGFYTKNYEISDEFYVCFYINRNDYLYKVFDKNSDEEYLPFYIKDLTGEYISEIRNKVKYRENKILSEIYVPINIKNKLLGYVKNKYDCIIEMPWNDGNITIKDFNRKKWYALIMNIPSKSLHIDREGRVDIINLKNSPERITRLQEEGIVLPAYHMNKKHWFTIILDKNVDMFLLKQLIDESYNIVVGK